MKTIRLIAAGAMLALSTGAFAQDITTDLANFEKILQASNGNTDAYKKEVKALEKPYKKDPEALAKIAKLFYNYDDTANARIFAEKSITIVEKKKLKFCDPYIIKGDIYYIGGEPGLAAGWYERAKLNDDRNPKAYEKVAGVYRKANPAASVEQLKELQALDPSYPANAVAAGFYYDAAIAGQPTWGKTLYYFEKEDISKFRDEDFPRYAYVLYLYKKYDKCIEVAQRGLQQFPEDIACNRYLMYSLQSTDKNQEAIAAFNKLHACPKYKEYADDYRFLGQAYVGLKDFAKGEEALNKSIALKPDQAEIKKSLGEVYIAKGDTVQGIQLMHEFVENYKDVSFIEYFDLTKRYDEIVKNAQGDAKVEWAKKEDAVFATMLEKFPGQQLIYVYYKRAQLNKITDETGLAAVPYYEKLVESAIAEDAEKHKTTINQICKLLSEHFKSVEDTANAEKYAALIRE